MKQIKKIKNYAKTEIKFQNFDNGIYKVLKTYFISLKKSKINRIKKRKLIKILIKNELNIWLKKKAKAITFLSKNPYSEQERKKWILELEPIKYERLLNIKKDILIENFKKDNLNLIIGLEHIGKNR